MGGRLVRSQGLTDVGGGGLVRSRGLTWGARKEPGPDVRGGLVRSQGLTWGGGS